MARCPQPFEILQTFKPKRGALHLGNFASMGAATGGVFSQDVPDELRDVVMTLQTIRAATFKAFKAYTNDPRDQIPATPFAVTSVVVDVFAKSMPFVEGVVRETSAFSSQRDSHARAVKRWNAAAAESLTRASKAGVLSFLTPKEAALFWYEASVFAIHIKVALDQPYDNPLDMAWASLKWAWSTAPGRVAGAIESFTAYSAEVIARAIAAAGAGVVKGGAKGLWDGFGPVLSVVAIGGLGFWAWNRYGRRRRA